MTIAVDWDVKNQTRPKPKLGMDHVISESCYKGIIFKSMTEKRSFSYNFFIKFNGEKTGNHSMTMFYLNPCYDQGCFKGTALH